MSRDTMVLAARRQQTGGAVSSMSGVSTWWVYGQMTLSLWGHLVFSLCRRRDQLLLKDGVNGIPEAEQYNQVLNFKIIRS